METKKIHPSQIVSIPFAASEDGAYGEFIVNVELNNEFIGRILQMGAGLEIVAPEEIRQVFKMRVDELAKLYDWYSTFLNQAIKEWFQTKGTNK